eukprot:359121_1
MASQQPNSTNQNEFFAMFTDLFSNVDDCKQNNVLKCKSLSRIKILLKQCDDIINDDTSASESAFIQRKIHDLIHYKFGSGKYTNINLLDDFHHVKYEHQVEEDIEKFEQIFNSMHGRNCSISTCKHLQHHYRDRTQVSTQTTKQANHSENEYALNLISRIHTYLIHSYDLNKLTMEEINKMNQELQFFKQTTTANDDNYDIVIREKKLEILYTIMDNKKGKAFKIDNNKYIEPADDNYQLFLDVLSADAALTMLSSFFNEQEYDTQCIYDDLQEKEQSNIYKYLTQNVKDKINQFDALKEVAKVYMPVIQHGNLLDHAHQNRAFCLVQFCGFTGSDVGTAKTFLSEMNWDITVSVDRYFMFDGDVSKIQINTDNHHRQESTTLDALELTGLETDRNDIYSLGTKYWFWLTMKNQPNYVEAKHENLKM